jgi:hypothetical protein
MQKVVWPGPAMEVVGRQQRQQVLLQHLDQQQQQQVHWRHQRLTAW